MPAAPQFYDFIPMNSPILYLVFNRPDCTRRSFEAIRAARPFKLYIAADGPRQDRPEDQEPTRRVRAIVTEIDWPCEVFTLFRENNLGCKQGVSSAIDWFFSHEEEGIILEDDCVASADFFSFCTALLSRYRDDVRVSAISGTTFVSSFTGEQASYRFTRYPHIWGWATWRRTWAAYDKNIAFWPAMRLSPAWRLFFPRKAERVYWESIFNRTYDGNINTWDYQLAASIWRKGGFVACPNANLVENIGFDERATHTFSRVRQRKVGKITYLTHPAEVFVDRTADRWYYSLYLAGRFERRFAQAAMPFHLALVRLFTIFRSCSLRRC